MPRPFVAVIDVRRDEFFVGAVPPVRIVVAVSFFDAGVDRVESSPKPSTGLAGTTKLNPVFLQSSQEVRHDDIARHVLRNFSTPLRQVLNNRPNRRPVFRSHVKATADRHLPAMPGLNVVSAATVIVEVVTHCPHDGQLIGNLSRLRQMF